MFQGKQKAITFSYDDGVTQDRRLIELFNRYELKATFNLNSELLGKEGSLIREGVRVDHNKILPEEVAQIYHGHEIAVHTLTHPNLTQQEDAEIIRQVEEDRLNLGRLTGYEVTGMAYPCGGINHNEHVAEVIRQHTGVHYCRTIVSSHSFALQQDLYRFHPTVHHTEWEKMFALAEEFLAAKPDSPQLFYIWGHSYEFDIDNSWDRFAEFCKLVSGKEDIFYGTNREIFNMQKEASR